MDSNYDCGGKPGQPHWREEPKPGAAAIKGKNLVELALECGAFQNDGSHGIPAGTLITFESDQLAAFVAARAASDPAEVPHCIGYTSDHDLIFPLAYPSLGTANSVRTIPVFVRKSDYEKAWAESDAARSLSARGEA